jgi:hypothetical protein
MNDVPIVAGDALARAEESLASRFTRVMNATPAAWGPLSDLTLSAAIAGVVLMAGLLLAGQVHDPIRLLPWILAVAAVPLVVAVVASLALRGSRARVVAWLVSVPFPIENLNALLAGVGDDIEVTFAREVTTLPSRAELQPLLEQVSPDVLLIGERADERTLQIRLGVIDSKRNPLRTHHLRWRRFCDLVERVLVPLSHRLPIARILVA